MSQRLTLRAQQTLTNVAEHGRRVLSWCCPSAARLGTLSLAMILAFPVLAQAQTVAGGASPATMINNVCTFILGPFGQSLAVLGIIAIGLSWMFGRVSLGLIAGVIGGIIIMFGASFLGATLTGGAGG